MWTKGQLVSKAFGELALAGFVFDITPEEVQDALSTMDAMLAEWETPGIRLGYAFPANPDDGDPDEASGIPDGAARTVYMNLAVTLAASYGKQLQPATMLAARQGYQTLLGRAVREAATTEQQMPSTLPVGAGNRWRTRVTYPFFPKPTDDPLPVASGDMTITPE